MADVDGIEARARELESALRVTKRELYEAAVMKDIVKWGHQRKMRRAYRYRLTRAKDALSRARRSKAQWLKKNQPCSD